MSDIQQFAAYLLSLAADRAGEGNPDQILGLAIAHARAGLAFDTSIEDLLEGFRAVLHTELALKDGIKTPTVELDPDAQMSEAATQAEAGRLALKLWRALDGEKLDARAFVTALSSVLVELCINGGAPREGVLEFIGETWAATEQRLAHTGAKA